MDEAVIKKKLAELAGTVARTPKTKAGSVVKGGEGVFITQPREGQATIEESIEALGLQVKYMAFDLEATRRENRYLRQMLESRPRGGDLGGSGPDSR